MPFHGLRTDQSAVDYVEQMLGRVEAMGVTRAQIVASGSERRKGCTSFQRIAGWAIAVACRQNGISPHVPARACNSPQDFFRIKAIRAGLAHSDVPPLVAALTDGLELAPPVPLEPPVSMREFRVTAADTERYYRKLRRAYLLGVA